MFYPSIMPLSNSLPEFLRVFLSIEILTLGGSLDFSFFDLPKVNSHLTLIGDILKLISLIVKWTLLTF